MNVFTRNFPERGKKPVAGVLINVMAKSVGQLHHASRTDTLDRTSLDNKKKINKWNSLMRS